MEFTLGWVYIQGILVLIGINLIAVLGLSILTGFTGLFSFGHGGFMAVGAYVAAVVSSRLGLPPAIAFPAAIAAGGLSAAVLSSLRTSVVSCSRCGAVGDQSFGEGTVSVSV